MQADISFCVACNTLYQSVHSNVFFFCFKDPIIHFYITPLYHTFFHSKFTDELLIYVPKY